MHRMRAHTANKARQDRGCWLGLALELAIPFSRVRRCMYIPRAVTQQKKIGTFCTYASRLVQDQMNERRTALLRFPCCTLTTDMGYLNQLFERVVRDTKQNPHGGAVGFHRSYSCVRRVSLSQQRIQVLERLSRREERSRDDTAKETDRETDRDAGRRTDRRTKIDRQTDRQTDQTGNKSHGRQTDRQTGRQAETAAQPLRPHPARAVALPLPFCPRSGVGGSLFSKPGREGIVSGVTRRQINSVLYRRDTPQHPVAKELFPAGIGTDLHIITARLRRM